MVNLYRRIIRDKLSSKMLLQVHDELVLETPADKVEKEAEIVRDEMAAAGTQLWIDPGASVPMVGASGAISGVMGAYLVRYPHVPVRVVAVLIIFLTTFRVPAVLVLGYWFVLQLLGGLPQLGASSAGVAFWAHIGGFVAGAAIAFAAGAHRRGMGATSVLRWPR